MGEARTWDESHSDPVDDELERDFDALLDRLSERGLALSEIEEWIKEGFVQWVPPEPRCSTHSTKTEPDMSTCSCKGEIAVVRRKGQLYCRACGGIAPSGTMIEWGTTWADVKRLVVK